MNGYVFDCDVLSTNGNYYDYGPGKTSDDLWAEKQKSIRIIDAPMAGTPRYRNVPKSFVGEQPEYTHSNVHVYVYTVNSCVTRKRPLNIGNIGDDGNGGAVTSSRSGRFPERAARFRARDDARYPAAHRLWSFLLFHFFFLFFLLSR